MWLTIYLICGPHRKKPRDAVNEKDLMPWPCECRNWCRAVNPTKPMTNHHPTCPHVDETLMDVWSVRIPGETSGLIVDDEENAKAIAAEDPHEPLEVVPMKMHREIYEHLPEFAGF